MKKLLAFLLLASLTLLSVGAFAQFPSDTLDRTGAPRYGIVGGQLYWVPKTGACLKVPVAAIDGKIPASFLPTIPAGTLSLTTTGTSGAASLSGNASSGYTLNIPNYATGGGGASINDAGASNSTTETWSINKINTTVPTAVQTALNGKQGTLTLTTTGTSGAATLTGSTLNIPNYATGGSSTLATDTTTRSGPQFYSTSQNNVYYVHSNNASLPSRRMVMTLSGGNPSNGALLAYNSTLGLYAPTGLSTRQNHTSGAALTILDRSTPNILVQVNPSSTLASLTVTLPAAPIDGQMVEISFGGTLTSGTVVTALTVSANTGHTILQNTAPTQATIETIRYRYNVNLTAWNRL